MQWVHLAAAPLRRSFMTIPLSRSIRRRGAVLAVVARLCLTTLVAAPVAARPASPAATGSAEYQVTEVRTLAQRNAVARTGAAIDSHDHGVLTVTATASELAAIKAL